MDHRVSKDMISSGMTPSGEKTQADLGKTQYGSAPSPNRLMDAYHSMYQNQKEETVDEGMVGDAIKKVKFQVSNVTDKAAKDQRRAIVRKKLEDANTKNVNDSVDLLAAYHAVYEHHKKDEDGNTIPHEDDVKEGKIPAGLQAYLDKKKGKKKDDDGDDKKESKKKDKKDVKEGAGLYANIHAKRKRGGKMRKKGAKGAPSAKDFANAAKTAKEDFEKYDLVYNHFISEGFSEEETYERMSNLTEEQLDEFITALSRNLATRAAKYGASLGGNTPAPKLGPARPNAKPGQIGFKAKNPSEVISDVNIRKKEADKFNLQKKKEKLASDPKTAIVLNVNKKEKRGEVMQDSYDYILNHFVNEGYDEKDVIQVMSSLTEEPVSLALIGAKLLGGAKTAASAIKATAGKALGKVKKIADNPVVQSYALNTAMGSGGGGSNERSGRRTSAPVPQYSSTDLFDIVKGQLLDEGLSEEEIKDIMLELTPEEILNEISVGKMANYISAADDEVQKTTSSIVKDSESGKKIMSDDPRISKMSKRAKGMAMAGTKIAKKMTPPPIK